MKKRAAVIVAVVAFSGLPAVGTPAQASCNEVGDPVCTVGGVAGATLCTATELAKSGAKPSPQEIADCFNQTTGP